MPEIQECFIHYRYAHYVLVEQLGLGQGNEEEWKLLGLFADSTNQEAGLPTKKSKGPHKPARGPTDRHRSGYVGQVDSTCNLTQNQQAHQTRIWAGTEEEPETLDGLTLSGLSYTPRSLILKFGRLDLQV